MYPTRRRWEFEPLEVRELLVADPFNLTQAANITADDIAGNSIVEFRITHGSDDAEEKRSGKMNITSNDLDHGKRTVGLRFNGIDIPMGANIVNAYLHIRQMKPAVHPARWRSTARLVITRSLLMGPEGTFPHVPPRTVRYPGLPLPGRRSGKLALTSTLRISPQSLRKS